MFNSDLRPLAGLVCVIGLLFSGLVYGHDARPISVEITDEGAGIFRVQTRVPDAIRRELVPMVTFPEGCTQPNAPLISSQPGSTLVDTRFTCDEPLGGKSLALAFPGVNPSLSTIVRQIDLAGAVRSVILPPGETDWQVAEEAEAGGVALQYGWLGVKHIWLGIDHLLFVLCLLFVAGQGRHRWRRILITVTGFTIAHSVTLVMSTLGMVSLPIPAVEAVIALSIVFLAVEICREDTSSLTYRYPVTVAGSFGLLHGFGFASVLREIGLPQAELPVALVMFNLGVEVGQVLFIGLALVLSLTLGGLIASREQQFRVAISYLVGTVATYWLIDRTLLFWQPV